jgi:serine O-acetyltransferase
MLQTLELIREDIRQKALWNYESDRPADQLKALVADGTLAMVLYRLMQASHRHGLAPLEMLLGKLNSFFGHCVIGRGADFGPGLVLIHSDGVVINGSVRGGANVKIEHQVTIGAEGRQSPTIGDDVFIGAGAKIIGPVTIGDGAKIGANAVVVSNVPAATTVVGIPARPVERRARP